MAALFLNRSSIHFRNTPRRRCKNLLIKKFFMFDSLTPYTCVYEEPSICPICKHALKPEELYIHEYRNNEGYWFLSVTYLCHHCFQTFIVLHSCSLKEDEDGIPESYSAKILYTEPTRYSEDHFDA